MSRTFVIVGGGVTAAAAVVALRREGFDDAITIVGEERHLPYERPPLSKEWLRSDSSAPALGLYPPAWYDEQRVQTLLDVRAVRIHRGDRTVELADGTHLTADAVLLATGGRPRRLPGVIGVAGNRIQYLRTVEDADQIAAHLAPGARVVIVGTGFIGAEVAAAARGRGAQVTALEMLDVPLAPLLGWDMGAVCAQIHREQGVDLRCGERVESIVQFDDGVLVATSSGAEIAGDVVVVGVGMVPNVEIANVSGIATDNGVVVDEYCQTSQAGVYAAGDVANHFHPLFGRRMRVEHYDSALRHGAAAAVNMLGGQQAFADPHWFWSDQYDHDLQFTGSTAAWDETVIRGSVDGRAFTAFYLLDGQLRAAFGVNAGRDVRGARDLLAHRCSPQPGQLRDPGTDLRRLARARA